MSVSVTVTRSFGDLRIPLSEPSLMKEIGDFAVRRIRTRTEQEISSSGFPFPGLSWGYAQRKLKALGSSRADLTVSGRMLNDMQVVETKADSVSISFISQGSGRAPKGSTFIQASRAVGAADKAYWHDVTGAGRGRVRRPFFDLTDEDEDLILERVERFLQQHLDRV